MRAERVVQPTDHCVRSVFASTDAKAVKGVYGHGNPVSHQGLHVSHQGLHVSHQGLLAEMRSMKDRLIRLMTLFGAVAAMALAGGASLKGF